MHVSQNVKVFLKIVVFCYKHTVFESVLVYKQKQMFYKMVVLKKLKNSQESTCCGVSFSIKLQSSGLQIYWKKDSGTVVFL